VNNLLAGTPSSLDLREKDSYWRSESQQYSAQRKHLTTRAGELETQIRFLDDQQVRWQATWDQIHHTPGIEAVTDRIQQKLKAIRVTRKWAQEQLGLVLNLQTPGLPARQTDFRLADQAG
jgi:hypothetical protein